MNPPPLRVRLGGSPLGALVLFAFWAYLIYGWWALGFSWWMAVCGLIGAQGTVSAIRWRRNYNAWVERWEWMSGETPKLRLRWQRIVVPAVIGVAVRVYLMRWVAVPFLPAPGELPGDVWFGLTSIPWLMVMYLAVMSVRRIAAAIRGVREKALVKRGVEAEEAPVAWLLAPAASSPTRAEAERALPEYAARVMERGHAIGGNGQ